MPEKHLLRIGVPQTRTRSILFGCLSLAVLPCHAQGQTVVSAPQVISTRPVTWAWYYPYDAISTRIHAQADLLRAHGDVAVDFAQARRLHAEAVDRELDNWLKHVRVYWERKQTRERERMELDQLRQVRKGQQLNDQKVRQSRVWDRLKNHPELTRVENGEALNFLLNRLSGTALAYEFVRQGGDFDEALLDAFQLDPDQLHGLQLIQVASGGQQLVFRADGGSGLDLEWWPYLLRWDEFATGREAFEKARADVLADADSGGQIRVENLQRLEQALAELALQFYTQLDREDWRQAEYAKRSQYRAAEAFLSRLDREIVRIQNIGDVDAFRVRGGFDPLHDGNHLIGLLTYMTRNGVQFAKAAPGDEAVYHTVFAMMRDLYVTVAAQDEGIQPKNLSEQIN